MRYSPVPRAHRLCPKAKFAHVDYGAIMKEMPGVDSIQKAIVDYQQELEAVGQQMADELKKNRKTIRSCPLPQLQLQYLK